MPIDILMPALSPTMTEGNLAKWLKREGDAIEAGEVIAEIETDKATMEVEAVEEGIISKIIVPEGTQSVSVNSLIAVLVTEDERDLDIEAYLKIHKDFNKQTQLQGNISGQQGQQQDKERQIETTQGRAEDIKNINFTATLNDDSQKYKHQNILQSNVESIIEDNNNNNDGDTLAKNKSDNNPFQDRIFASPVAKRIATIENIDLKDVKGSGPRGRIVKDDIIQIIQGIVKTSNVEIGNADTSSVMSRFFRGQVRRSNREHSLTPHSNIRKIIAQKLCHAKQTIPHFYLSIECKIDNLTKIRSDINKSLETSSENSAKNPINQKLSINDFIILASARALSDVPAVNASWSDDGMVNYNNVDVSVAVAIDDGLITPIIRNADQKDIFTISQEMKTLIKKAKANKLTPEEFQGGGFCISNLGMYDITNFQAIINPPQSCILAVGKSEQKPCVIDDKIGISNVMSISMSCDHRVVDGAIGAKFLSAFKRYIECPILLFI